MTSKSRTKAEIKRLVATVQLEEYSGVDTYLRDVYQVLKENFSPYSYRHFSEDLGLGYCPTSRLIIVGERIITEKTGKKVCTHLGLIGKQRSFFLQLVKVSQKNADADSMDTLIEKKQSIVSEPSKEQLEYFRNWYNSALLEFLRFYEGDPKPALIGKHMIPNVSEGKITASLKLLQTLGYIVFDPKLNKYEVTQKQVHTNREVMGIAYKAYHDQYIGLGKDSLTKHKAADRSIEGTTLKTSKEVKAKIKEMFHETLMKAIDLADNDPETPDEVTQVNLQIFPTARQEKGK